jgi:hypothetical protein
MQKAKMETATLAKDPSPYLVPPTATLMKTIALLENAVYLLPVEILRIAAIQTMITILFLVWGYLNVATMDFVEKNVCKRLNARSYDIAKHDILW